MVPVSENRKLEKAKMTNKTIIFIFLVIILS